jgi:outer membrane protein assembly factor BamB
VDLDGNFSFDAVSNSGASLYLIETVPHESTATPGLGYKVRLYDLNTATLQPGVVVDKTAIAETMSGTRQSSMISPDGQWVYSLYLNQAKGPFIHMLNLNDRYAICVFLPTTSKEDLEKQLLWSLAQTRDGKTLYAVNGALGVVAEVDTTGFSVRRTVTIPMTTAERPGVVARVGNWLMPSVSAKGAVLSSGAALTPDGTILFVVAEHGLFAVNTRDLTLRGRYLSDMPLSGINLSPDGVYLYAVSEEENKLLSLDAATGGAVKEIAGATHPWGVLGVG